MKIQKYAKILAIAIALSASNAFAGSCADTAWALDQQESWSCRGDNYGGYQCSSWDGHTADAYPTSGGCSVEYQWNGY